MRWVALVSSMLLCSCATTGTQSTGQPWSSSAYEGFAASIDVLVGQAVDCGFFVLVGGKPGFAERRYAYDCVQRAIRTGVPFKYGTERLPMDSFATEVIARAADGKLWRIVFDVMIDGDAAQQWNQTCQTVTVDPRTMIIDAQGCVEYSTGRLGTN